MTHKKPVESDEWYTPKYIFDALGCQFDLDVACPKGGPRYTPCRNYFDEGSLEKDWFGLVWMNPPYTNAKTKNLWLSKFINHGNGIALMPDSTSAQWFRTYVSMCGFCVFTPRIRFEAPDGSIGSSPANGTALISIGTNANAILERASSKLGILMEIRK